MNRRDYFFRQLVTEAELDAGFEEAEKADRAMMVDFGLVGVSNGQAVTQHAGTPNLTVDVTSGVTYDQQGQRCAIASTQSPSMATDYLNVSTAVSGAGNEKWVSLFLKFARALSDPRLDGNNVTVYFVRDESYSFHKVQGAEAVIGAAIRPALISDGILLADVQRTFGQTQILNANISTTRRENAFKLVAGALSVEVGTPEASDAAILALVEAATTDIADHIADTVGAHAGTAVSFVNTQAWADTTGIAAIELSGAVNEVVQDLARTNTGNSGGGRVGTETKAVSFTGAPFDLNPGSVAAQIGTLLGYINGRFRTRTLTANFAIDDAGYRDEIVCFDSTGGAPTCQLPNPTTNKGRRLRFVDVGGNGTAEPLLLARYTGTNINGYAGNLYLEQDFGQWEAVCDGVGWFVA